jgi:2-oxoglutarate dehydrogenase E1 component
MAVIMKDFSYITNSSPAYIESLYNEFLTNPENVDPDLKNSLRDLILH